MVSSNMGRYFINRQMALKHTKKNINLIYDNLNTKYSDTDIISQLWGLKKMSQNLTVYYIDEALEKNLNDVIHIKL